MYACKRLAAAQQPVLFPTAPFRKLSQTPERRGGAALSGIVCAGGPGGKKHSGGTKPAAGGPCDEELMKPAATPCGGWMGYICLCTTTIAREFVGMWC